MKASRRVNGPDHVVLGHDRPYAIVSTYWIPRITRAGDLRVFMAISSHANLTAICWPKRETIALETGMAEAHVSRAIVNLEKLGALRIHRRSRPLGASTYEIVSPAEHKLRLARRDGITVRARGDGGYNVINCPKERLDDFSATWNALPLNRALEALGHAD